MQRLTGISARKQPGLVIGVPDGGFAAAPEHQLAYKVIDGRRQGDWGGAETQLDGAGGVRYVIDGELHDPVCGLAVEHNEQPGCTVDDGSCVCV